MLASAAGRSRATRIRRVKPGFTTDSSRIAASGGGRRSCWDGRRPCSMHATGELGCRGHLRARRSPNWGALFRDLLLRSVGRSSVNVGWPTGIRLGRILGSVRYRVLYL